MLSARDNRQIDQKFRRQDSVFDARSSTWAVFTFSGEDMGLRLEMKQDWSPRSILIALRRAGIEMPHHTTVQNDLMTGRVYVLVNGLDWLTLKEMGHESK